MKFGPLPLSVIAVAGLASPSFAQVSEADRLARCQNNQARIDALENEIKNSDDLKTVEQLARARADLVSARQIAARLDRLESVLDTPEETNRLQANLRMIGVRYHHQLVRGYYKDVAVAIEARIGRALASQGRARTIEAELARNRTNIAALQCNVAAVLNIAGIWYMEGDRSKPTSVNGTGANLLFTNENRMTARGHVSGPYTVVADDWEGGLVGMITDNGRTIAWGNGTNWRR